MSIPFDVYVDTRSRVRGSSRSKWYRLRLAVKDSLDQVPHLDPSRVLVAVGIPHGLGFGPRGKPGSTSVLASSMVAWVSAHDGVNVFYAGFDQQRVMHRGTDAMFPSVGRQPARRNISAPWACIGKFRRLRAVGPRFDMKGQPKTVRKRPPSMPCISTRSAQAQNVRNTSLWARSKRRPSHKGTPRRLGNPMLGQAVETPTGPLLNCSRTVAWVSL